ncbi:MAG: DUF262 domain-containing protein [Thermodesulfobacteriota bacterium]|nr:DUF262 domain-containing protein [Thermodesulfobacteriota bacterium]
MKTTLFKEVGYSLSTLIDNIDMGIIGLPDIQRPFVWKAAKVRDLFDSMYKGFPVGYLLFWANGLENGHKQIGVDKKQKVPDLLIIDGQQRLTALYSVMKNVPIVRQDYTQQKIMISFRPKDQVFDVTDAAIIKDPECIADISVIWSGDSGLYSFTTEFIEKLRQNREVSKEEEKQIADTIGQLHNLRGYPFTALELSRTINEEQVSEVFVRINSKGVTLNQADFILTLMSVFWDEGRKQLEEFCRTARQPSVGVASSFNYFIQPAPDQLLRVSVGLGFRRARLQHVYSILRGKDLETEQFSEGKRIEQFDVLKNAQAEVLNLQNWSEFFKTLMQAGFHGSSMISSQAALLYAYVIFLVGKKDFLLGAHDLRNIIARWFFMSSLTARYSSSPETTMEADLARLRSIRNSDDFIRTLDQIIFDTLTEDFWNITLPNSLATSSARSPSLFAYYAALNLLDAQVLFSQMKVSKLIDPALKAKKAAIERHHLFPKNYLKKLDITELRDTNQIANYALVEWTDNIDISDEAPAEYLPRYLERFGEHARKQMYYWHALPEGWENMEYEDFLISRRKVIASVIRDGFDRLWQKEI